MTHSTPEFPERPSQVEVDELPAILEAKVSVVIPSYQREQVLLNTLDGLLALNPPAQEIIVVDQTPRHAAATDSRLTELSEAGSIRWIRLREPSIMAAMNHGLLQAVGDLVLFVDDDVEPSSELLTFHREAQKLASLVVGQVLQPGESASRLSAGEPFRFNSTEGAWVSEFIGCNFSVDRRMAIDAGGFDENFVGAAFRYEAEFSHRFIRLHGRIRFEPRAWLRHLRESSGGTRAHGTHLRTTSARHSVGAYYCLFITRPRGWLTQLVSRPLRAVRTRHHLLRPWWIPLTLIAEARGFVLALRMVFSGQRLLQQNGIPQSDCTQLLNDNQ